MEKIREILRLSLECHLGNREIGRALKVSHPVVGQYLNNFQRSEIPYLEVIKLSDTELLEIVNSSKKRDNILLAELEALFPKFAKELKRKGVTLQLLWEEYKENREPHYSYSQFCFHFQVWRQNSEIAMHIEHKAGDKMFCDFTGQKWPIYAADGSVSSEAEVFISVLGASLYTFVEAVPSQRIDDWIRLNTNAFHFYGGVSAAIVPDNLKSAVQAADKYEPALNPQYEDFARHYHTVIFPARPYRPKDKALVENAVKLIYRAIFAPLRNRMFYSIPELNAAIRIELAKFNNREMKRYQKSRLEMFEETEKSELKELPKERYELRKFFKLKVQKNYHIYSSEDRHNYSVPYRYRGKHVKAVFSSRNLEIYYNNERIALHERNKSVGRFSTLTEHMPPEHKYLSEWTPEKILSWSEGIGPDACALIGEILKQTEYPEQAYKSCAGIKSLQKTYGQERLNLACRYAIAFKLYSYRNIKNILENSLENRTIVEPENESVPLHENIRGAAYYAGGQS